MSRSIRHIKSNFTQGQQGFSIVELLIAGLLGLILLAGVVQLFLGSNRNYTMQDELASLQEDGRFALMFLQNQIQAGGWLGDLRSDSMPLAVDITQSSDSTYDSFAVSFNAVTDGTENRDCNGTVVSSGEITNRFYVSGTDLMCQGNGGGTAQPLLSGIEAFQILYGVETESSCPDGVVNNYLNRTDVISAGLAEKIISIRIGLLLQSSSDVLDAAESNDYTVLNTTYTTPSDKRIRRLFQQTIFMPNAGYRTVGNPQQIIECMAKSVGSS